MPSLAELQQAAPARLYSKGPLPWRLLAYLLELSPEVNKIRSVIRKRLLDSPRIKAGELQLDRMLLALHKGGYVKLEPAPPEPQPGVPEPAAGAKAEGGLVVPPETATATDKRPRLLAFRGVNPMVADWLCPLLVKADDTERLQLLEGLMEVPGNLAWAVRVPEGMPPGPLQREYLDPELVKKGLIASVSGETGDEEDEPDDGDRRRRERPPTLADRARMLFEAQHPEVGEAPMRGVWAAGEILRGYSGDFEIFVKNRDLLRQEGVLFRHLLRLILLAGEFARVPPEGLDGTGQSDWRDWMRRLAIDLTGVCAKVDPQSTEQTTGVEKDPLLAEDVPPAVAKVLEMPKVDASAKPLAPIFGAGLGEELD